MAHNLQTLFPDLLPRLERIMAREGWTRYYLGSRKFARPNLVFDIEAGKSMTSETIGKVYDFVDDYEVENGLPKYVEAGERDGVPRGVRQSARTRLQRAVGKTVQVEGAAMPSVRK